MTKIKMKIKEKTGRQELNREAASFKYRKLLLLAAAVSSPVTLSATEPWKVMRCALRPMTDEEAMSARGSC